MTRYAAAPALERLDARGTGYQFDLEQDVAWGALDAPGAHLPARWLVEHGVDAAAFTRAGGAAEALLQDALAYMLCEDFVRLEEHVVRFAREGAGRTLPSRSLALLCEEEAKHIRMFRRYERHVAARLAAAAPGLATRIDALLAETHARLLAPPAPAPAPGPGAAPGAAPDGGTEPDAVPGDDAGHHYLWWLNVIFFEEYTVHLAERLLAEPAGLQPTWVSLHRAHRREEVQHLVTDTAYVDALELDAERRLALSRTFAARMFAVRSPYMTVAEAVAARVGVARPLGPAADAEGARVAAAARVFPESARLVEGVLRERAFRRTRAAAPFLARLASVDAGVERP